MDEKAFDGDEIEFRVDEMAFAGADSTSLAYAVGFSSPAAQVVFGDIFLLLVP